MRKIAISTVIFILSVHWITQAQISEGGEPLSFIYSTKKSISSFSTPDFDYQKMKVEDEQADSKKPFRFGKVHDVKINPENYGVWQTTKNGKRIWQLRIYSKGAYSLGLIFDKYKLNYGAKIFIYSVDRQRVIGAFTSGNNKKNGWFSTSPVAGQEIIIELNVDKGEEYGEIEISGIVHDYKNTFGLKTGFGASGSCNVNINCPDGVNWQDEKRAVVRCVFGGSLCTGILVNNTANDEKPYLLTANHCVSANVTAVSALFWFNYESENCIPNGDPFHQSISSSELISTGDDLDFSLLELSVQPPADYNVYYAGWNNNSNAATSTTTIHHPEGDIKKISFDYQAPVIDNYGSGYIFNSHWKIGEWDIGTTEPGSSGAPLFDQDHLIVGNLTGGDASCSFNFNDYFSRFDLSWDYHNEPTKQLKIWLDPINSGVEKLSGYNPVINNGLDASLIKIIDPLGAYCYGNTITPTLIIANRGTTQINSLTINYQINDEPAQIKLWSGTLNSSETDTVKFDEILLQSGNYNFKAYVSLPNADTDVNLTNDTLKTAITVEESIDASLSNIIDPNGTYCALDSVTPKILVANTGNVEIKNFDVYYQINGGEKSLQSWSGNLKAGQAATLLFKKIKLPFGHGQFMSYVSGYGCGIDIQPNNDTLIVEFNGQNTITEVEIDGSSNICQSYLSTEYTSLTEGDNRWFVTGGEIVGPSDQPIVIINWDDWGVRNLDLNVTNYCNSFDAETIEINAVEQALSVNISVGDNGSSVCWSIEDCDGNILTEDCDLPSNSTFIEKVCVPKGCYRFTINSGNSGVKNYSITRITDSKIIISGNEVIGSQSKDFILNAISNYAEFNIYPNPSSTTIAIEANFVELYEDASFAIYNQKGSLVTPYVLLDDRKDIDVSNLPRGLYIVKFVTNYGEFSIKFLKQ